MITAQVSKPVRITATISVAVVAGVAAVVSYEHMHIVAQHAGEGWRSWLEPLSVDGLLIGASMVLCVNRRNTFAWIAVAVGILVSLAANLAAAQPTLISRVVSAWPAIALALSYETLLTLVRTTTPDAEGEPVDEDQALVQQPADQTPAEPEHPVANGATVPLTDRPEPIYIHTIGDES